MYKTLILTFFMIMTLGAAFAQDKGNSLDNMRINAALVFSSLTPQQLKAAFYPFQSERKKSWRYFPSTKVPAVFSEHTGIKFTKLNEYQKLKVLALVETALSDKGFETVKIVRTQEDDPKIKRKVHEKAFFYYGSDNYFISFFGKPGDQKWMWRFEGHHVSINITIENGYVTSAAPFFLGINPSEYIYEGSVVNTHEDIVGKFKALNASLSPGQQILLNGPMTKLPKDLLYTPSLFGKLQLPNAKMPFGLDAKEITSDQQQIVFSILETYLDNLQDEGKATILKKVRDSGLQNLQMIFVGDKEMNGEYYWRIQGPSFVFEFMTADKNQKHYHVAWQDLK